jgi:hypothetical protein
MGPMDAPHFTERIIPEPRVASITPRASDSVGGPQAPRPLFRVIARTRSLNPFIAVFVEGADEALRAAQDIAAAHPGLRVEVVRAFR